MKPVSKVTNEDNMEMMKRYPDNFFELAIVDPPYGLNISVDLFKLGQTNKKNGYKEWEFKDWDSSIPNQEYFDELFRVSKNQIIWGGNYFPLPPTQCWLIWDKMQRGFSFADGELAWTSFKKSVRIFSYSRAKSNNEGKIHVTQKPVALYEWLMKNYAKYGDKILDTHLGSGSSRIAAFKLGFDFYGCEIDKDYFEESEKRFKREISVVNHDNKYF